MSLRDVVLARVAMCGKCKDELICKKTCEEALQVSKMLLNRGIETSLDASTRITDELHAQFEARR
jgi:hypothetical protein